MGARDLKRAVEDLALVPFLETLNEDALRDVASRAKRRQLKRGDEMAVSANGSREVVVIGSGKAYLVRRSPLGRKLLLAVVGDGDLVGRLAKRHNDDGQESLVAVDPVVAYVLPRDDFEEIIRQHPAVAVGVTRALATQSREREAQLADLALRDVHHRAAGVLGRLAEGHGTMGTDGVTIRVRVTHQDLADMIGCSRESVTVALGELRREGLLGVRDRQFLIPDLAKLKNTTAFN